MIMVEVGFDAYCRSHVPAVSLPKICRVTGNLRLLYKCCGESLTTESQTSLNLSRSCLFLHGVLKLRMLKFANLGEIPLLDQVYKHRQT